VSFISTDPAGLPSTRASYVPRRTSAPIALCVSLSVAGTLSHLSVDPFTSSVVYNVRMVKFAKRVGMDLTQRELAAVQAVRNQMSCITALLIRCPGRWICSDWLDAA